MVSDMQEGLFIVENVELLSSIEDLEDNVSIRPNPIQTSFEISTSDYHSVKVTLLDITGRIVQSWEGGESTYFLHPSVSSGAYICQIRDGDKLYNQKVMVVK